MKLNSLSDIQGGNNAATFDLFRLSRSKATVDICPNTLRSYHREGLPFYRKGKAVFISRRELELFLRSHVH